MARYTDLQQELDAMLRTEEELRDLSSKGVVDAAAVEAVRRHYDDRRAEIDAVLSGTKSGLSKSAVAKSSTVPVIAWIGIVLSVAAVIAAAASVWDTVGPWGRLAMLAVPALGCYVASHLLHRRPETERLAFMVLAGANVLLVSTLVYVANEWELGRDDLFGQDVGFAIATFTTGLAAFWARRLDSTVYRLVTVAALTVALTVGGGLIWANERIELNRRDEAFWSQWNEEHEGGKEVPVEGEWQDPYAYGEGKELADAREALARKESVVTVSLVVLAGLLVFAVGSRAIGKRGWRVANPYLFGGTLMPIGALVSLHPDVVPGELDGFIPLLVSLAVLWYGLRSQRGAVTIGAVAGFFPALTRTLGEFISDTFTRALVVGALGIVIVIVALRFERYRTRVLKTLTTGADDGAST